MTSAAVSYRGLHYRGFVKKLESSVSRTSVRNLDFRVKIPLSNSSICKHFSHSSKIIVRAFNSSKKMCLQIFRNALATVSYRGLLTEDLLKKQKSSVSRTSVRKSSVRNLNFSVKIPPQ
jgi:hypothetical protein